MVFGEIVRFNTWENPFLNHLRLDTSFGKQPMPILKLVLNWSAWTDLLQLLNLCQTNTMEISGCDSREIFSTSFKTWAKTILFLCLTPHYERNKQKSWNIWWCTPFEWQRMELGLWHVTSIKTEWTKIKTK